VRSIPPIPPSFHKGGAWAITVSCSEEESLARTPRRGSYTQGLASPTPAPHPSLGLGSRARSNTATMALTTSQERLYPTACTECNFPAEWIIDHGDGSPIATCDVHYYESQDATVRRLGA
jgi:hypothetical protein